MNTLRRFHQQVVLSLFACVFAADVISQSEANGGTVLSISGDDQHGGWVVIYTGQGFASSWTQTNEFTNVTVLAHLGSFGVPGQTGRAYLTSRLGPGTTVADELASTEFTFPLEAGDVPLFAGLSLPPGTYYLSMVGNSGSWGSAWFAGICNAKVETADGVSLQADYGFAGLASYLPASSLAPQTPSFMRFRVATETNQTTSPPPTSMQANLRAYTTASEVLLTWDAIPGADHYLVYRAAADLKWKLASGQISLTQFRDGDYSWFPTYYRVVAVGANGERSESETTSVSDFNQLIRLAGISVRPLSETAVSIDWEVNQPTLNQWGVPAPGGARALLELGATPSNLSFLEWDQTYAGSAHHVISNLAPNSTYWYRLTIMGTNDVGFNYLNSFVTQPAPEIQHVVVSVPNGSPSLVTDEDTPVRFTLVSDQPYTPLAFAITCPPSHGTITGTSPDFLYSPAPDWDGFDVFCYSATDGMTTNSGVVTIMLRPLNDAPVALEPLAIAFPEDEAIPPLFAGIDFDDEFGPVSGFTVVTGPTNGMMQAGTYIPNPNFHGIDHVTYRANDGQAEGNIATVRIRVNPVNDPPFAQDQAVTVPKNTPQIISLSAGDVDGDLPVMFITQAPSHGALGMRGVGLFDVNRCHGLSDLIYSPDPDFTGIDRFEYTVQDGTYVAGASVTITVVSPNRAPQAISQSIVTEFGIPISLTLSATDADGDALTYTVVSGPAHGTLSGTPPQLLYTPAPGYAGPDSFAFSVNDGRETSQPATVAITINAADAPPLAPSGLVASAMSGHRIELRWNDRSSYEKGFRIERAAVGGAFKQIASVNANVVSFSDGGVQPTKTYVYRVRAYNKSGDSDYSNTATATAIP